MVKVQEYTSGDEFKDISKKGKDRHWKERKRKNVKLAGAFKRLNYDKKFVGNMVLLQSLKLKNTISDQPSI